MLVLTKIHSLLRFPCVAGIVQTHIWPFATSWTATHQAPLSSTVSQGLFKFMSIESMMLSNHLIFYCSLLFSSSISTGIRVFPNELALLIRWPKYWSFSFSRSSCNECSGLISFRTDKFDLLSVQSLWLNFIFPLRVYEPVMELGLGKGPSLITSWVSLCSLLNWAAETSSFPTLNQRRMTQMWREIIKLFLENEQPWAHLRSTVNNMKFEVNIIVSLKWVCTKFNSVFYPIAFLYFLVIMRTGQIVLLKVEI